MIKKFYNIIELYLKRYIGGEIFFKNIDTYARKYLIPVLFKIKDSKFKNYKVICSGTFGKCSIQRKQRVDVLLPSGLRLGKKVDYKNYKLKSGEEYIYLDDTYCTGATVRAVEEFLNHYNCRLKAVFVAYDGSKIKEDRIISLYRYYDKFK